MTQRDGQAIAHGARPQDLHVALGGDARGDLVEIATHVLESVVGPDYDFGLAVETNSIELMKRLAQTVPNLTFLNAADIGDELRAGTLTLVPVREIDGKPQVLSLMHRSRGTLDPAANLLANDIRTALDAERPR